MAPRTCRGSRPRAHRRNQDLYRSNRAWTAEWLPRRARSSRRCSEPEPRGSAFSSAPLQGDGVPRCENAAAVADRPRGLRDMLTRRAAARLGRVCAGGAFTASTPVGPQAGAFTARRDEGRQVALFRFAFVNVFLTREAGRSAGAAGGRPTRTSRPVGHRADALAACGGDSAGPPGSRSYARRGGSPRVTTATD